MSEKGSITIRSTITFVKKVFSKNTQKYKRKNSGDNNSPEHLTPCETLSVSTSGSQDNELATPPTSPAKQCGFMEEFPEDEETNLVPEKEDNYGNIETNDVEAAEDYAHIEDSPNTKELFFEDDDTKVIFHFNEYNQWSIEIVENYRENITSLKKKGVSIPSIDLKSALSDKVDMQQSREYVMMAISKDYVRVRDGVKEAVEFLMSVDSTVNFTSVLTNDRLSRGLAKMKTVYEYTRIIR